MAYLKPKPYALRPGEGRKFQSLGARVSIKATSGQTGGAFNLFTLTCPPGYATPLHIHYGEDVIVYVLEGKLRFFWGSEQKAAVPGSFFFQPRDIPHGFRVEGSRPARILYLTIPAGFDQFILEQEHPTAGLEEEAAARYKIEILGPLPE